MLTVMQSYVDQCPFHFRSSIIRTSLTVQMFTTPLDPPYLSLMFLTANRYATLGHKIISNRHTTSRHLRFGHHDSEPLNTQISLRPLIPKSPRRANGTLASSLNDKSLMYLRMCAINRFFSGPIADNRHRHTIGEKKTGKRQCGAVRIAHR